MSEKTVKSESESVQGMQNSKTITTKLYTLKFFVSFSTMLEISFFMNIFLTTKYID